MSCTCSRLAMSSGPFPSSSRLSFELRLSQGALRCLPGRSCVVVALNCNPFAVPARQSYSYYHL